MKYDVRKVMKRAWEIKKENDKNIFGECLRMAWEEVKGNYLVHKSFGKTYVFEIVDKIPVGYQVWSISMEEGYVALAEVEEHQVNVNTLKAVKIEHSDLIRRTSHICECTVKGMERYINRNSNSTKEYTRHKVEIVKKALEALKTIA